jgi:WD40 repeat protein
VWDLTTCTRTGLLSPLVWGSDVTITAVHYAGVAAEGYLLLGTSAGSVHAVECLPNCSLSGYSITSEEAGFPPHLQERDGIPGEVVAIECNPVDPSYALIGYAYGGVLLWEWSKRRKRLLCEADRSASSSAVTDSAELTCIAWHPKGKAFAAGYSDGCYAIFDAGSPAAPVRQLKPCSSASALTPIVQLQWLRTRHGDTKVWVLAVAGGGDAHSSSAMDGVSLLVADVAADVSAVSARSMKKYGPTADLKCAAFVPLAASGEQLLSATVSLEPAVGDAPPLFTVMAMTVGADSTSNTATTALSTAASTAATATGVSGNSNSSSNSSGSDDESVVAMVSMIKFATLVSPAPLSIELCTGWPLPQPHPLCSRAAVTCTAVLPPMPAFALMNMISTACEGHSPQYTAGSSSSSSGSDAQAKVLRRGAVVWAPGLPQSAKDETACLSELVVLGHADGSLTLWEACAPPLPLAASTASSKGSKSGSTGATAVATAAGATATSPLVFWGELPVHEWTHQHLLSLVTAISSSSSSSSRGHTAAAAAVTALCMQPVVSGNSGCYIGVGFADGLSTLLDVNSRPVDSAHPALCTVIALAKPAPAARRGSLIGSPSHDADDTALGALIDDAQRELAYSEPSHSSSSTAVAAATEARPAAHPIVRAIVTGHSAAVSCVAVRCEASSASFEPSLLLAVADAAGGASLSNITARTGVELVLPKPDTAASNSGSSSSGSVTLLAFEPSTVATRTGTPCTLFAALPWKLCAFDGATAQQLIALPLDLDFEPAATATGGSATAVHQHPGSHELCGLYCLEADEEDEGMPSLPPSLLAAPQSPLPTPPPRRGSKVVDSPPQLTRAVSARLVVACGSRVAVVSFTKSAKVKKGTLTVEALNTVMPPRQSKRASESSAGCAPHSGLFDLPTASSSSGSSSEETSSSERKCIAVVDVGGGLTAFLLPSLTAVYHDQLSQGAPCGCATVSSLGEVLCRTGPRELARWSLVQHYRGPALQQPGAVRRCQVAALQDDSSSSSTADGDAPKLKLREKLKARQLEGKAAGLRRLFDEAVASASGTAATITAAGSTGLPSPADSTSSTATASSSGRSDSRRLSSDASGTACTARAKSELFGGKTTSSTNTAAAAAADKRTKAAGDGVSQAHSQIAEATRLAHLRTEKLNTMEEKSAALNSRAENFASLAAQLNAEAGKDDCCVS